MTRGTASGWKPGFESLEKNESGVVDRLVEFRPVESVCDEVGKFCGLGVGMVGRRGWGILWTCEEVGNKPGTQPGNVFMAVERVHLWRGSWSRLSRGHEYSWPYEKRKKRSAHDRRRMKGHTRPGNIMRFASRMLSDGGTMNGGHDRKGKWLLAKW
jgi:hypothetical protein